MDSDEEERQIPSSSTTTQHQLQNVRAGKRNEDDGKRVYSCTYYCIATFVYRFVCINTHVSTYPVSLEDQVEGEMLI